MTRCFALAALAVVLTASADAQISFSADDFFPFDPGEPIASTLFTTGDDVSTAEQSTIDALIALTGANRTWDFTTITFDDEGTSETRYYDDVTGLPGASEFSGANFAFETEFQDSSGADSSAYIYGTLTAADYTVLGTYVQDDGGNEEFVLRYDPDGLLSVTFPYTNGTMVADEATLVVRPNPSGVDPTYRQETAVIGYGTLVLPTGSYGCLMEERTITTTTTFMGQPFSTTLTLYSWVTKEGVSASATNYQVPQGPRAYSASYTVMGSAQGGTATEPEEAPVVGLVATPNPAGSSTTLHLTTDRAGSAQVTVWDALGREAARLHDGPLGAGPHGFTLDTSALAPGVYLARVVLDGRASTLRLTVAR